MVKGDVIFFSQEEPNWYSVIRGGRKVFEQSGYKRRDWENCRVSAFPTDTGKVRVNIRRTNTQYSMYMKRKIEIKFLYSFEISSVEEPIIEKYDQSTHTYQDQQIRWMIHLKKQGNEDRDKEDCWIWQ